MISGVLSSSEHDYRIVSGVPRFEVEPRSHAEIQTVEEFGDQWSEAGSFSWTYGQDEEYFRQYFYPLSPEQFRGSSVLDAGCGNGRLVEFSLRFEPRLVVGLDYSRAVEIAFRRTRHRPNVLIVQGSILEPPLVPEAYDVIYSLGVIHHLDDPSEGVARLSSLLKMDAPMHLWTYSREGNELYLALVRPLRFLGTALPSRYLKGVSFVLAAIGWPYVALCSMLVRRTRYGTSLPLSEYLAFLHTLGFRVFALVIHDQLNPTIARYPTRDEVLEWCRHPELSVTHHDMRTGNSWRIGLWKRGSP